MIEIRSTDLAKLNNENLNVSSKNITELYNNIYWKLGAMDLKTNSKTYTLKQFEKKYDERLLKLAKKMTTKNLWEKYKSLSNKDKKNKILITLLKEYDLNINVNWKLAHYKSAAKYLYKKRGETAATGGTNWKSFLPPKFQKIMFFPDLWTKKEKENWGKTWVKSIIK
jgi:tryptophan 2,3-dioxygenase